MEDNSMYLQQEAIQYVHSTGRWYKFFAILGIITIVFLALLAIGMFAIGGKMDNAVNSPMAALPTWFGGLLLLIVAGIEVPIVIYLMRAARVARAAVETNSNEALVEFLRNTKSFWKYNGIVTIVAIAFYIVYVLIAVIVAAANAASMAM